ncbi:MAG: hypothetical protein WHU94_16255 [Thermogemmata sp.]
MNVVAILMSVHDAQVVLMPLLSFPKELVPLNVVIVLRSVILFLLGHE